MTKDPTKKIEDFQAVAGMIINEEPIPLKYRDHPLKGKYRGRRECHIYPDWLLIYKLMKTKALVIFERTGSHSELFD